MTNGEDDSDFFECWKEINAETIKYINVCFVTGEKCIDIETFYIKYKDKRALDRHALDSILSSSFADMSSPSQCDLLLH